MLPWILKVLSSILLASLLAIRLLRFLRFVIEDIWASIVTSFQVLSQSCGPMVGSWARLPFQFLPGITCSISCILLEFVVRYFHSYSQPSVDLLCPWEYRLELSVLQTDSTSFLFHFSS